MTGWMLWSFVAGAIVGALIFFLGLTCGVTLEPSDWGKPHD